MTISRINHSCAPNVVWSWINGDKSKVMKQVRVVRVIKEGEEILVRYQGGNEVWSRDERQIWLRNWNFICNCEVCSMTGDELMENEKARKKMGDLGAAMDVKSIEKVRDPFLSLDCTGVEGHVQVGKAPLASLHR